MNPRLITALVAKDLTLFFRNRYFTYITIAGLFAYIGIYFAMPRSVDETLELGLFAPSLPPILEQLQEAQGLSLARFDSLETLQAAVINGQYPAGIALPAGFLDRLMSGDPVRVDLFFGPDIPDEMEGAASALIQQYAVALSGQIPSVDISRQVLGPDLVGQQIPPRDRLLPLIAAFTMLTETLGLASLISEEVVGRTLQAILITPLTIGGLFLAKGLTGVGLAFGQSTLFMVATGSLVRHPALLLTALFLGAVLVTGIGFLIGSLGKDLTSVMTCGIPVLIVLSIPAFGVMFPGLISDWVRFIPSFYLADTIHQAANFQAGWGDVWGNLVILLAFDVVFVALGVTALRRKFR
jgi:ABC-2 type transport system permease protein